MSEKYNGWANRETWLVNLHFGDSFEEMVREDVRAGEYTEDIKAIADGFPDAQNRAEYASDMAQEMAERYGQFVAECIYDELEKLSGFLSDFIDLSRIDWYELGMEVVEEIFF